jgi:CHAD domain-containing protein
MEDDMLAADERAHLQNFANQSPAGTPFLRRARIVLLDDEGATQETIAAEVQVPITRVRQLLRAYKREGANLFPETVWSTAPYQARDPVTDVARYIIASLATQLEQYEPELAQQTSVVAVHESRKTTRKMRTAFRLFESYFRAGLLRSYRKRARKFMRRLGRSRDVAVLLLKLESFLIESYESDRLSEQERQALAELANYWREQQIKADRRVRRYLAKGKYQRLLVDLKAFGHGDAGAEVADLVTPRAAYIAPVMIYEKVGHVRAMGADLDKLQPERLHALRISCKELRYTLEFFEGLLGLGAGACIETVKLMLTHLGDINDARVHLKMLDEVDVPELAEAADLYRDVVEDRIGQLRAEFPGLWAEFDQPEWRKRLATAISIL